MDLTKDIAMLLGGPTAAMVLLWFVLARLLPHRDDLFASSLREVTLANQAALKELGERLECHTDRITERLDALIATVAADRGSARLASTR